MSHDQQKETLEERINRLRAKNSSSYGRKPASSSNISIALQYLAEFLSGVVAGVICGYICDKFFGTKFVFMIICFLLGIVAGVNNVWRKSRREDE